MKKSAKKAISEGLRKAWRALPDEERQRLIEIKRAQAEHGIEGGRPPDFPSCTYHKPYTSANGKQKIRHRFERGICRCGIINAPGLYRCEVNEGSGGKRVWYRKTDHGWEKIN